MRMGRWMMADERKGSSGSADNKSSGEGIGDS